MKELDCMQSYITKYELSSITPTIITNHQRDAKLNIFVPKKLMHCYKKKCLQVLLINELHALKQRLTLTIITLFNLILLFKVSKINKINSYNYGKQLLKAMSTKDKKFVYKLLDHIIYQKAIEFAFRCSEKKYDILTLRNTNLLQVEKNGKDDIVQRK
jgi:hypothetical protein